MIFKRLLLLFVCVVQWGVAQALEPELAKVIAVIDGDTVLLQRMETYRETPIFYKLRLADIDAPEKSQDGGEQAKQALENQVLHKLVRVSTVATDVYGREIGWMYIDSRANAKSVNEDMVESGWAWALPRHRSLVLRAFQQDAQRSRRGLWAHNDAMAPWVWRRQHRPHE